MYRFLLCDGSLLAGLLHILEIAVDFSGMLPLGIYVQKVFLTVQDKGRKRVNGGM